MDECVYGSPIPVKHAVRGSAWMIVLEMQNDANKIAGIGLVKNSPNLPGVPILKGTVPHTQKGKFGGAEVLLKPATPGTGVIAGGAMRAVLESVGVHNVLAKSQGSSNPHNVIKATMDALTQMRDAVAVAKQRGITIDQVFNG